MANLGLPEIPSSFMFYDEKNEPVKLYMTIEWQEFFRGLFERTGGTESTDPYTVNLDNVAELLFLILEPKFYDKDIERLNKLLQSIPESKNYDNEIDNLHKIIASGLYEVEKTITIDNFEIIIHTTSQVFTLADLKKIHIFNSALNLECTLPSVVANDVGKWIICAKAGAGDLTINAPDADTILDSTAGGSIECTDNTYEMPKMGLILMTETEWHSGPECFGVWETR